MGAAGTSRAQPAGPGFPRAHPVDLRRQAVLVALGPVHAPPRGGPGPWWWPRRAAASARPRRATPRPRPARRTRRSRRSFFTRSSGPSGPKSTPMPPDRGFPAQPGHDRHGELETLGRVHGHHADRVDPRTRAGRPRSPGISSAPCRSTQSRNLRRSPAEGLGELPGLVEGRSATGAIPSRPLPPVEGQGGAGAGPTITRPHQLAHLRPPPSPRAARPALPGRRPPGPLGLGRG